MITTSATSQNRKKREKKKRKKTCSGPQGLAMLILLARFGYFQQRNWEISVFLV
jgi:hypothetical protein